jgi:16S rRNA (cytosine1407-C5)-methyltransferase
MLPALSLDLAPGMRVLDACAAPGSKTTQIGALLKNQGVIVACEKQKIRSEKLTYNLRLQGVTIARVHNMDLQIFSQHHPDYLFDRILIDAPCSAEGRISLLDEKTFGFWTEENIQKKALIQTQLIETAAQHLVHNAILVYATCTLAPEENECIIDTFLEKNQDFSLVPAGLPLIPELRPGLSNFKNKSFNHDLRSCARILPSKTTEGFFIAKLHKLK